MSSISKETLIKRGLETFVKKFLSMDGKENKFLTNEGLFTPHALVLDIEGDSYAFESNEKRDYEIIIKRVEQAINISGAKSKIQFTGRFDNTNQIKTIKLTDIEKTGEFGGQGAGSGKKENLGLVFEREFYESLVHILDPSNKKGRYDKQARETVERIGKEKRLPLSEVIAVGELNQRRPLRISPGSLTLGSGEEDIGSTVTDITLKYNGKEEVYLSLKFQSTLAFANIGIGTVFTEADMKKYTLSDNAMSVLKVFGLDYISFCETFNKYPHSEKISNHKIDVSRKVNKSAINKLLRQMMGYGYVMVHGKGPNNVEIYDVDQEYFNRATTITGPIVAFYGGTTGTGKKVIVNCESSLYKFSFNFRNKGGKLYPSHIMCDYKKK
tara:strand:+ start:4939 stop:6087 length:1149 start_codon:yes stop_codon:yes gene_type:complete